MASNIWIYVVNGATTSSLSSNGKRRELVLEGIDIPSTFLDARKVVSAFPMIIPPGKLNKIRKYDSPTSSPPIAEVGHQVFPPAQVELAHRHLITTGLSLAYITFEGGR